MTVEMWTTRALGRSTLGPLARNTGVGIDNISGYERSSLPSIQDRAVQWHEVCVSSQEGHPPTDVLAPEVRGKPERLCDGRVHRVCLARMSRRSDSSRCG